MVRADLQHPAPREDGAQLALGMGKAVTRARTPLSLRPGPSRRPMRASSSATPFLSILHEGWDGCLDEMRARLRKCFSQLVGQLSCSMRARGGNAHARRKRDKVEVRVR